jgi:formamidopyrimidine-DNA glycosylase
MTGRFVFNEDPGPYTRAMITLDKGNVQFHDVRQFGTFEYCRELPEHLTRLGPDALEITLTEFQQRLRAHNRQIKPLLLDQNFLRGMGNIYVDEALFRALIHPRTIAAAIKPKRSAALHQAMLNVLTEALAGHGSSISSFKDPYGREGSFHNQHRVYGKAGELCPRCGKRKIVREVVAQRGTHFCPKCQPE